MAQHASYTRPPLFTHTHTRLPTVRHPPSLYLCTSFPPPLPSYPRSSQPDTCPRLTPALPPPRHAGRSAASRLGFRSAAIRLGFTSAASRRPATSSPHRFFRPQYLPELSRTPSNPSLHPVPNTHTTFTRRHVPAPNTPAPNSSSLWLSFLPPSLPVPCRSCPSCPLPLSR